MAGETPTSLNESIHVRRRALRECSESNFVQRDEFCKLLVSFRKMVRSDEPALNVRGPLDLKTGTRFLIEDENLFGR
jgi:hypothetical protein